MANGASLNWPPGEHRTHLIDSKDLYWLQGDLLAIAGFIAGASRANDEDPAWAGRILCQLKPFVVDALQILNNIDALKRVGVGKSVRRWKTSKSPK